MYFITDCQATHQHQKKNYQSITDPMVLDKIDIVSDSESSLSSDGQFILAIIDDIDCIDLPSSQSKVDEHLKQVHQQHPHVLPVEPGRVYKMDKILDNIQDQQEASDESNQPKQNTQRRPKRNIGRSDYKMLHNQGITYSKKK